jgi:hypothetical protein
MQWGTRGAHLLLQPWVKSADGELGQSSATGTYSDATKDFGVFEIGFLYVITLILQWIMVFIASGKSRNYFVGSL